MLIMISLLIIIMLSAKQHLTYMYNHHMSIVRSMQIKLAYMSWLGGWPVPDMLVCMWGHHTCPVMISLALSVAPTLRCPPHAPAAHSLTLARSLPHARPH